MDERRRKIDQTKILFPLSCGQQKKGKRFVEQSQEKDNNAEFNSPWAGKVHQNTSKQQSFSCCQAFSLWDATRRETPDSHRKEAKTPVAFRLARGFALTVRN